MLVMLLSQPASCWVLLLGSPGWRLEEQTDGTALLFPREAAVARGSSPFSTHSSTHLAPFVSRSNCYTALPPCWESKYLPGPTVSKVWAPTKGHPNFLMPLWGYKDPPLTRRETQMKTFVHSSDYQKLSTLNNIKCWEAAVGWQPRWGVEWMRPLLESTLTCNRTETHMGYSSSSCTLVHEDCSRIVQSRALRAKPGNCLNVQQCRTELESAQATPWAACSPKAHKQRWILSTEEGNSLVVWGSGLHAFTATGQGSTPGQGMRILQTKWWGQK